MGEQASRLTAARCRRAVSQHRRRYGDGPSPSLWKQHPARGRLVDCPPRARRVGVAFDFRYNAERAATHRQTAREFLDTARSALEGDRLAAFTENLYAAVELMAKGSLLTSPDDVLLKVRQHRYVAAQYNLDRKLGNVDPRFAALLNDLAAGRKSARYAEGELRVDPGDARDQLAVAEEMYEDLGAGAPTRAPSHDDEAGDHEGSDP